MMCPTIETFHLLIISPELFPSLSTRSLMFLKLSDLALPQMLAVEVLGALQEEEEEGLSPPGLETGQAVGPGDWLAGRHDCRRT